MANISNTIDGNNPDLYLIPFRNSYVPWFVFHSTAVYDGTGEVPTWYVTCKINADKYYSQLSIVANYMDDDANVYTFMPEFKDDDLFSIGYKPIGDEQDTLYKLRFNNPINSHVPDSGGASGITQKETQMFAVASLQMSNGWNFPCSHFSFNGFIFQQTDVSKENITSFPSQNTKGSSNIISNYFNRNLVISSEMDKYWTPETSNFISKILGTGILFDPDDPDYNTKTSSGGGGGGSGKAGGDTNEDDGLPSLSATDCGLLTAFSVNKATLTALGNYLWSDSFDINTFKKMFNDPFDAILGLQMIPITPTDVTAGNIIFGNTDTGISANIINNQWVPVDMGTLDLKEIYNGALDYEPTTQVSIYLPYIGVRQLNTVDVMASSLHLIYKFDVLTGSVIAQLYVNHQFRNNTSGDFSGWTKNQGFLYSFEGQCSCNVPLSSQDYSNIVRSAISGVGMAAGAAASVATGNPAIGAATLAVGMANSGIQSQGSVIERSGHLSGTQGFLDYQTPMLFVIRPHRDKPSKYYNYRGVPAQTTATLANCSGYTQIADGVTISAAGATQAELDELTTLCRQGVIL